ncbi:MAG: endonuclease V [Alphaproteobacteria bacterium]|nr:endonuclease V [Alphaproteobacteria bacterium]
MLIAALDAAYSDTNACAACVVFEGWAAERATHEEVFRANAAAAYEPGAFYKRELPLLLEVLKAARVTPDIVVIDGYVRLDAAGRAGLGAHLHAALGGSCAVVGVAKTAFADAPSWCSQVVRGSATRPLYVTAIGMSDDEASAGVRAMHGAHRIPTFIQRADRLAREALP